MPKIGFDTYRRRNGMSYPPLAEVRKTLRVDWYRCRIEHAKLRELSKRSDLQGGFQAGGHLALFAVTGALAYLFWSQQLWLGFVLALFAHGTVASFFVGVAPHELGHGTVFRTKWLNKFFMYLFSLLSWWDPFDYASSHTYHHRYTLHPEGDRENLLPLEPSIKSTFMLQLFTVNLLTQRGRTFGKGGLISTLIVTIQGAFGIVGSPEIPINEWIRALHADQPEEYRKSIRWSRILLLFHGSVLLISIITGVWVLPLIFTVAPFIANWAAYFVGLTQHCGLREDTTDFRKCVRSVRVPALWEFLYWRMNWHTEHHMYAGVPCYNLKKLYHEIADDMPEPRTLLGAWREMRETWQRQKIDPTYQFDTPLPPTAKSVRTDAANELEHSIGELAPEGLQ
jgi:fatty acid desaturase